MLHAGAEEKLRDAPTNLRWLTPPTLELPRGREMRSASGDVFTAEQQLAACTSQLAAHRHPSARGVSSTWVRHSALPN